MLKSSIYPKGISESEKGWPQTHVLPAKVKFQGVGKRGRTLQIFREKKILKFQIFPEERLCCLHFGLLDGRVDPGSDPEPKISQISLTPAPQPPPALSLAKNKAELWQSGHQPLLRLPLEGTEGSWCLPPCPGLLQVQGCSAPARWDQPEWMPAGREWVTACSGQLPLTRIAGLFGFGDLNFLSSPLMPSSAQVWPVCCPCISLMVAVLVIPVSGNGLKV